MNNVCVMLVYLQNDLISRWFKQRINYIEKANKEHYQRNSESIKPLRRKMIHCFEALQSDRESFVSERDFKARFANHLFPSGTSKRVSRIICFRAGLQSAFRIICFRAGLQSAFRESFVSERDFKARFANHLFPSGTSKRVSRIICFRAGLQIIHQRQGCRGGARGGLRGLKPRIFFITCPVRIIITEFSCALKSRTAVYSPQEPPTEARTSDWHVNWPTIDK